MPEISGLLETAREGTLEPSHLLAQVETLMQESFNSLRPEPLAQWSREHLQAGGRRLRARMALEVGQILNVETQWATSWAAACELLHNATLVLDDIQDQDCQRRGQPTLWQQHGLGPALNVGELLLMWPHLMVRQMHIPAEQQVHLLGKIAETSVALVCGQTEEHLLQEQLGREDLWQLYLEAISGKTSPLFELPVWGSVFLAKGDPVLAQRWAQPFRQFGVVFQLADDLADALGKKQGRSRGADLCEGKVSALIPLYLKERPDQLSAIKELLRSERSEVSAQVVEYWLQELQAEGVFDELKARIIYWLQAFTQSPLRQENPEIFNMGVKYLKLVLSGLGWSQEEQGDFYAVLSK